MRTLLVWLVLTSGAFGAIPSQRDALSAAKREAQTAFVGAQKGKDSAAFLIAAAKVETVGAQVIAANSATLGSIPRGTYPIDIKSRQARDSWDRKMADIQRSLSESNRSLAEFPAPTEQTPASVRAVEAYLRLIDKAIEAHHAASLNLR